MIASETKVVTLTDELSASTYTVQSVKEDLYRSVLENESSYSSLSADHETVCEALAQEQSKVTSLTQDISDLGAAALKNEESLHALDCQNQLLEGKIIDLSAQIECKEIELQATIVLTQELKASVDASVQSIADLKRQVVSLSDNAVRAAEKLEEMVAAKGRIKAELTEKNKALSDENRSKGLRCEEMELLLIEKQKGIDSMIVSHNNDMTGLSAVAKKEKRKMEDTKLDMETNASRLQNMISEAVSWLSFLFSFRKCIHFYFPF